MEKFTKPQIGRFYTYDHSDYTNLALCYRVTDDFYYFIEHDDGSDSTLWFNRVTPQYFEARFVEEELADLKPQDFLNYNGWIQFDEFRKGVHSLLEKNLYYDTDFTVTQADFFDVKVALAIYIIDNGIEDEFGKYHIDYYAYLQTPHWKEVRNLKLHQVGGKCQLCGATKRLEIHHNSYEHLGKEEYYLNDLIVLCHECHAKFHNKI